MTRALPEVKRLCVLCCQQQADSEDHFIPKCSGNSGRVQVHYGTAAENGGMRFATTTYQNGFWTRTLCSDCNLRTARFATAYRWLVQQVADAVNLYDPAGRRLISIRRVFLSRAIGQMYAMLLSIMPIKPADKWKPLQQWLLDRHAAAPTGLPRVRLYLNRSTFGRIVPPCGIVELGTGGGALVAEVTLPPLGMVFEFEEYDRTVHMADISDWIDEPYDRLGNTVIALPEHELHSCYPLAFGPPAEYQRLERQRGGFGYLFKSTKAEVIDLGAFIAKGNLRLDV